MAAMGPDTHETICVPLKCQKTRDEGKPFNMEQRKNKRGDGGRLGDKPVKAGVEQTTVKEEEVDEFFAILGRIRVAVEYFDKGGRALTEKRWRPSFRKEDFEGVDGSSTGDMRERSLDLNSDPPPPSKDTA